MAEATNSMQSLQILVEQMSQQLSQIAIFGGQNTLGEHSPGPTNNATSSTSTIVTRSVANSSQAVTMAQSSGASIMTVRNAAGRPFLAGSGETIRSMSSFNFESTLLNTKVYSKALYRPWMHSTRAGGWSVLSGRSLAEISNISVLELPLYAGTLSNPWWYDGSISSMDFLASLPAEIQSQVENEEITDNPMESLRNLHAMSWPAALHILESTDHATTSSTFRGRPRWADLFHSAVDGRIGDNQVQSLSPEPHWALSTGPSTVVNSVVQELDSLSIKTPRPNRPPQTADICYCEATARESPFIIAVLEGNVPAVEIYLTAGTNVHELDRIGNTALSCAAKVGRLEMVRLLLDRGANVNSAGISGLAALQWAASCGHSAVIELLLARGADVAYCCSSTGPVGLIGAPRMPHSSGQGIWHAARVNHREAVSAFLNHAPGLDLLQRCERCWRTILDDCSVTPDPRSLIIKVLYECGGPWEVCAAFLCQAMDEKNFGEAARLARYCTGRELIHPTGRPMLYSAIEAGAIELIEVFWSAGVESAWYDVNGRSPLHFAAELGSAPVVACLLRLGSDTTVLDSDGHTPLYYAIQNKHDSVAVVLTSGVSLLDDPDSAGYLDLHEAALLGLPQLAEKLLKLGIPVDRTDPQGCTALHKAAACGHDGLVELLLTHGSNRNARDNQGNTPLVHAVRGGQLQVAQRLCQISPQTVVVRANNPSPPPRRRHR